MHRYIIKRLFLMIPVIIGVSFLVFFIMDMAPGDAVDLMAPEGATAEDLDAIRHELGLDQRNAPWRYGCFLCVKNRCV